MVAVEWPEIEDNKIDNSKMVVNSIPYIQHLIVLYIDLGRSLLSIHGPRHL